MTKALTLKDVSVLRKTDDINLLIGEFLDGFYYAQSDRASLIHAEPEHDEVDYMLCFIAAAAHKLANDFNLSVPKWVFNKKYIYPTEYYPRNTDVEAVRQHLKKTSPAEFAQRNVFFGQNVLRRV
jgi:hypothetical protein